MSSLCAQVIITDFGTGTYNVTFNGFDSSNQTATSLQLIGDNSESVFGDISPSPVDISSVSNTIILLVGTLTASSTADGAFQIELFDVNGSSRTYGASWSDFTPDVETSVAMNFEFETGLFDPSSIASVGLLGAGLQTETLNFTANKLLAVPEPSALFFLGMAMISGSFFALRGVRRRIGK